ncbi:MAG TPA: RNA degradosome polyphosphate kinase [Candidatus Prevotella avicola]|uniref:Polyphosphate kinase n=1 Tax=Candidatus Prevotella avicola TaxID=2838738 RepID=A0A9D2G0D7_9BACT|nr:RNA degradosome polyphosphate kinase [Candidatus Prevotella avicola]
MGKEGKKKENYVDRDVSWMYFNHRILQEGRKEYVPLLERLSFLGIYSNNLDEFFRVRVASLNRLLARDGITKSMRNQIKKSLKTINLLNETYSQEYTEAVHRVLGELALHKIRIVNEMQLNEEQKKYLTTFFYEKLNGSVNPIWLSEIKDLSSLEDNRIYLLVEKSGKSEGDKPKYAIIKVPDRVYGRWQKIPSSEGFDNIMYLDDVVRYCLPLIFIGFKESQFRAFSFKFTKDAEMDLDTENEFEYSTVEKVAAGVDSRRRGEAVRLLYDKAMPKEALKKIKDRISATEWDTMLAGGRYQNHKDLMSFPACGHEELRYPKWPQIMPPEFLKVHESVLDLIRQRDLFIHVPYHSFNSYIRVLQEAAIRPEVKVIKTTLYRLAKDSKVVKALITAARNGKEVTAVVELLARFDEESNIKWSKRMQEEGVNVIFGVEGLKIHSKLLYLESKKGNIACVGTGNFHEGNAKIYTDYMMMTARPRIVNEVAKVFNFIDRPFSQVRFQELMVSPNSMKSRILRLLDTEIKNAQAGKEAWVKIKINHITEPEVVNKLYHASCAGVKIDILIRGNCSLVPGVPGLSENIRCVGIIDRYLEHSRVLIFCNGGNPRYYLGSADWMPRNLLNRIEVMTPVYDEALRADLLRTVEYGLKDTTNARVVDGKGTNEIQKGEYFRSQEELYKAYLAENENGN